MCCSSLVCFGQQVLFPYGYDFDGNFVYYADLFTKHDHTKYADDLREVNFYPIS